MSSESLADVDVHTVDYTRYLDLGCVAWKLNCELILAIISIFATHDDMKKRGLET